MDNNKTEDQIRFEKEIKEALIISNDNVNDIKICDTPQILLDAGMDQKPILYSKNHLKNAIAKYDKVKHHHGISINSIYNLPQYIKEPAIILKNYKDKTKPILVFNDINSEKSPLFAVLDMNGDGVYNLQEIDSNYMLSIYGKDKFDDYLRIAVDNKEVVYYDKEKVQDLEALAGLSLSNCTSILEPNKILQQINENVNNVYLKAVNNVHITRCSVKEFYKNINEQDNNNRLIVNNKNRKDMSNEK